MSNQTIIGMTIAVVVSILVLMAININSRFHFSTHDVYIKPGDVRGTAIDHEGKLYTLNFNQQNHFLEYLNTAVPVKKTDYQHAVNHTGISKMVIYRFNASDIGLIPISLEGKNLVFSAPDWNSTSYLMELSGGQLISLLEGAYDH